MTDLEKKISDMEKTISDHHERIKEIEFVYDCSLFSNYMGKINRVNIYRVIEMAVAEYFGIKHTAFYDSLLVGTHHGARGRNLPLDPINFKDDYDRMIAGRQVLYGILHVDFHVPVPNLSDYYNVEARKNIDKWRDRYIRCFKEYTPGFKSNQVDGQYYRLSHEDQAYKNYYLGVFKLAVEISEREGLYDELFDILTREGLFYSRLKKWRIG